MSIMSDALRGAGFDVADIDVEVVTEKPVYQQVDWNSMSKKQRKNAVFNEEWRLVKDIPYMWNDFARVIAQHNFANPEHPITDDFLKKVIAQGEKMDIFGADAKYCCDLQTRNSDTNYSNLVALMGNALEDEMNTYGVSWGYFASLYDSIYRKKFGF